jgi:hypothetical protein
VFWTDRAVLRLTTTRPGVDNVMRVLLGVRGNVLERLVQQRERRPRRRLVVGGGIVVLLLRW